MSELATVTKFDDALGRKSYQVSRGELVVRCSRLAGGVAWPALGQPGFLIVLAQAENEDVEAGGVPIHVINEFTDFGGETFMSVEPMLEALNVLRGKLLCGEWFGLECPRPRAMMEYNRNQAEYKRVPIRVREVDEPDFGAMLELVFRRTVVRKLLHFGDSCLPGLLSALPSDAGKSVKFHDHPPITALLFALAGLEGTRQGTGQTARRKGAVDRVAGY